MPTRDEPCSDAPLSRDELVAMVARAHQNSAYGESSLAGRTLSAQSRLPKVIAENLGAGFGRWEFFPEAAEIVDFACAYVPPSTQDEMWTMAHAWASDDAAKRHTVMALVGREILQHELRRIDVPKLRELFGTSRPAQALAMRASLGLAVPASPPAKASKPRAPSRRQATVAAPVDGVSPPAAAVAAAPAHRGGIPTRMPKPALVRPAKAPPPPAARRFHHPKFGEGVLESEDGVGPDAKLTIKFKSGSKTVLARYVTDIST